VTAALARLPRMDALKYFPEFGEDRCRHDMLIFGRRLTCAICLRLPDVPDLDNVFVDDLAPSPARWIVTVETAADCVRCYTPLPVGRRAVYSAREGGVVGPCCEAVA
jgi:hypothetical protein